MDIRINFSDGVVKMTVCITRAFPNQTPSVFSPPDMAARVLTKYRISRYPATIGRYKMLRHRPDIPNQLRFDSFIIH